MAKIIFQSNPRVHQLFDDLEKYLDFCKRFGYNMDETDLYNKRQTAFKDDIHSLQSILLLAEDELRINSQLEASGDVSRAEILRLQRSVADIKAQMSSTRNKYFQDAQAEMTKAQEDLSTQSEQLKDRSQVLEQERAALLARAAEVATALVEGELLEADYEQEIAGIEARLAVVVRRLRELAEPPAQVAG
jgi:chromosome segregation ATPase